MRLYENVNKDFAEIILIGLPYFCSLSKGSAIPIRLGRGIEEKRVNAKDKENLLHSYS